MLEIRVFDLKETFGDAVEGSPIRLDMCPTPWHIFEVCAHIIGR